MPNTNEFDQAMFEDSSTINFGGEDGFDLFAGFDEETDETGADAADTTGAEGAATQDSEDTGDEESAGTETEDAEQDAPTTEQPSGPEKLTFTAKIDHKEQEISIGADELPTIYQKAANMDRAVQRADAAKQDAERYKGVVNNVAALARKLDYSGDTPEDAIAAMISGITKSQRDSKVQELVSGGTAQEVAEFIVDQRMQSAETVDTAEPDTANEDDPQDTSEADDGSAEQAPSQEQFAKDLQELLARRPELVSSNGKFPEEVIQAYVSGENLTVAYLDYESKKNAAEKQALEKQTKVLKHNQESARRAPVKGVSSSGGTGGKEDPWLAGFDDEYW